eukprot:4634260-Prymnesium_polylepis.1
MEHKTLCNDTNEETHEEDLWNKSRVVKPGGKGEDQQDEHREIEYDEEHVDAWFPKQSDNKNNAKRDIVHRVAPRADSPNP